MLCLAGAPGGVFLQMLQAAKCNYLRRLSSNTPEEPRPGVGGGWAPINYRGPQWALQVWGFGPS